MAFHWSAEAVERLAVLWGEGHPASMIAGIIAPGELSRCAVIGKIDRLHLVGPRTRGPGQKRSAGELSEPPLPPPGPIGMPRKPIPRAIPMSASPDLPLPASRPVTIGELHSCHCRWPLGDPQEVAFRYCGAPKEPERSYCVAHARMSRSETYTYQYRKPAIVAREYTPTSSRILDAEAA